MPKPFVRFETYSEDVARKTHDHADDTLRVYLTNTAPNAATHSVRADVAEITAGSGYTAGGPDTENGVTRAGAVTTVTGNNVTITAAGGTIGPFQYAVLYNDTPTAPADPLIGFWDYETAVTLADGESFTVQFPSNLMVIGGA